VKIFSTNLYVRKQNDINFFFLYFYSIYNYVESCLLELTMNLQYALVNDGLLPFDALFSTITLLYFSRSNSCLSPQWI